MSWDQAVHEQLDGSTQVPDANNAPDTLKIPANLVQKEESKLCEVGNFTNRFR